VTIVFADLHLKESTEEICFRVLDRVGELALEDDRSVVFCGDWWHLRYQVNVRLLNRCRRVLETWAERGIQLDLVPGNHDQVTIDGENALEALAVGGNSVRCWTNPGGMRRRGFVPYRKDPERQLADLQKVCSTKPEIVFAHFGASGSLMDGGRTDLDGIMVPAGGPLLILGHYHRHQRWPSYTYVGSPYQQSFGEVGNVAGVLRLKKGLVPFEHVPLDLGPRHWVFDYQPGKGLALPAEHREGDRVRIDVRATAAQLAEPGLLEDMRRAGVLGMQVNVVAQHEARAHRFELQTGESLGASAERFVRERVSDPGEVERRMVYLRKWTGAVS